MAVSGSGKRALENKLDALRELTAQDAPALRKALADRNNYLVSKAATKVAELNLTELVPDLAAAFDRFMIDPVETDPQCWSKNAIAKALKDLSYDDPALYLRGIEHVQREPVWGTTVDTAGTLRGACALALPGCALDRQTILTRIVTLLADPELPVRLDAITALGQVPGNDTELVLRLKVLLGDKEPEVTGRCFDVLLELAPNESIPFVARFLNGMDPDLQSEAIGALASSRRKDAADLLLPVIEKGRADLARVAIVSLGNSRFREDFRAPVEAAVKRRDIATLDEAYRSLFPPLVS